MKPSIPETGTVVRLEGLTAVVMLNGGHACKGCGAGKMGLCNPGGNARFLKAENRVAAQQGDIVRVGLDNRIRRKGYFLSFVIPIIALFAGALAGSILSERIEVKNLDVIFGFAAMITASLISYSKLRALDTSSSMIVLEVLPEHSNHNAI
ncbi:MAG: SoxR reducing system RseC family protein [Nitrospirae bacterium]|nr:SoxR reducing system RseC family protein [Nitrospirota bacterium]